MTDNEPQSADQQEGKPLGLNRPGRLELKKTVESGQVRQSFSHGRTKTVQVEKKKKRTFQRSQTGSMTEVVQSKSDESLLEGMKEVLKSGSEEEPLVRHLTVEENLLTGAYTQRLSSSKISLLLEKVTTSLTIRLGVRRARPFL